MCRGTSKVRGREKSSVMRHQTMGHAVKGIQPLVTLNLEKCQFISTIKYRSTYRPQKPSNLEVG